MASINQVVEGLKILSKYCVKGTATQIGGASHDVLWGPCVGEDEPTDEDRKRLDALGWHFGEEDCWSKFV